MSARQSRQLPKSLLRALERLDYHQLGVIEALCLSFTPTAPGVEQQERALYRRHPALREPTFTDREKKIYDDAIREGATQDQALDKIEPLAEARRRRALKRTRMPGASRRREAGADAAGVIRHESARRLFRACRRADSRESKDPSVPNFAARPAHDQNKNGADSPAPLNPPTRCIYWV